MSIGNRLLDLVRSNLTNLLHYLPSEESPPLRDLMTNISDEELEAELTRRRQQKTTKQQESQQRTTEEDTAQSASKDRSSFHSANQNHAKAQPASGARPHTTPSGRDPRLAQLYALLECPYGADLNTVRKHYRALMLKYHPDKHGGNPERQRLATELTQRLTQAYNELRRIL